MSYEDLDFEEIPIEDFSVPEELLEANNEEGIDNPDAAPDDAEDTDSPIEDSNHKYIFDQAAALGLEIDQEAYLASDFTEAEAKEEVLRLAVIKKAGDIDPTIATLIDEGVTIDEYLSSVERQKAGLASPDDVLVKGDLYNAIFAKYTKSGIVKIGADNTISKADETKMVNAAIKQYDALDEAERKALAITLREELKEQIAEAPQRIAQEKAERFNALWENNAKKAHIFVESINKSQAEGGLGIKEEMDSVIGLPCDTTAFSKYVYEQLSPKKNKDGSTDHTLLQELRANPEEMAILMRLKFHYKNGGFKDLKSNMIKEAVKKISFTQNSSKSNTSNPNNGKGRFIAD